FSLFHTTSDSARIYTLSLHDALPILIERTAQSGLPIRLWGLRSRCVARPTGTARQKRTPNTLPRQMLCRIWKNSPKNLRVLSCQDRKSTRLNSSHDQTSYAVFCLKIK